MLKIKDAKDCKYDLVSLGESMIRLSPPQHGRIEFAPMLEVWVGGGEYNVSYALSRLGLRTAWIGGLNSSPMGAIVRNHARAVGMDVSYVVERKYDGVGKKDRIGLNFTEVGVAKRGSVTLYDRGHTATSGMKPGDVNWKRLFNEDGVRWLHTGGIFAALSEGTRAVVAEAVKAAHEAGTIVSYDLNFRSKLWKSEEAIATTKPLVPYIDCLIGNEEDFQKVLGYAVEGVDIEKGELDTAAFKNMVNKVVKDYANIKIVGTTLRGVKTATINDWSAIMWADGKFYDGVKFDDLEIEDRVGGGDGFASGFTYGFLTGKTPQECVNLGVTHGALLMSTMGDTSQITLEELLHTAGGEVRGLSGKRRRIHPCNHFLDVALDRDTVAKLEAATPRRIAEATSLQNSGHGLGAIYLGGYAIEMRLATAYFRLIGFKPNTQITEPIRRIAVATAVQQKLMGRTPHDLWGWARFLVATRKDQSTGFDAEMKLQILSKARYAYARWRPNLRYRALVPTFSEVSVVIECAKWFDEHYNELWR